MNLWHNIHIRKYFTIWHSYQTIWFWQSKVKTWQPLSTSVLIYLPGIQYPCHRPFSLSIRRLEYYVTAHKLQAYSKIGKSILTEHLHSSCLCSYLYVLLFESFGCCHIQHNTQTIHPTGNLFQRISFKFLS